ncbi:MAG: PQQ-binding-like beta-propeller repeat protein, partial [Fimbriiglobus sp.]
KNIRWTANVGSRAIGGPVVANGLVWVGTNNESLLDPKITDDRGVYACFRESDGRFLGQYASRQRRRPIDDLGTSDNPKSRPRP